MNISFNSDDDDFDGDDDDFDNDFDKDDDGFSDEYEELMGSDPLDPTDLPFYPPEVSSEPFPRKTKANVISKTEEENQPPIRLVRGSPTRNKCLLVLILFIIFFALAPFIVFMILS
ncbi:MAG: hypothetical protein ACXABG_08395 [Promethearchaeota archaeon]|jgi:hypothetical protein